MILFLLRSAMTVLYAILRIVGAVLGTNALVNDADDTFLDETWGIKK